MSKNRRYNNKRKSNYPTGTMRLDAEIMSEIRLFVSLGHTLEDTARRYNVSVSMVKYSCRMGKDFDSLQDEYYKEVNNNENK